MHETGFVRQVLALQKTHFSYDQTFIEDSFPRVLKFMIQLSILARLVFEERFCKQGEKSSIDIIFEFEVLNFVEIGNFYVSILVKNKRLEIMVKIVELFRIKRLNLTTKTLTFDHILSLLKFGNWIRICYSIINFSDISNFQPKFLSFVQI